MKTFDEISRKLIAIAVILLLLASIPVIVMAMTNSGNVSGIVTYTGSISGTQDIYIGVHTGLDDPPVGVASATNPGGVYSIANVDDGQFWR